MMTQRIVQRRTAAVFRCLALFLSIGASAAPSPTEPEVMLQDAAAYIMRTVPAPQVGYIGGEWAILGLARGGCAVPDGYYRAYLSAVEAEVRSRGGVLSDRKYTEYSRVILALTALGQDPRSIAGYDLTLPLGDYEKTTWQGLNGPVWALIALDAGGYPMPVDPDASVPATRQSYVDHILSARLSDGGWSLSGGTAQSDPDVTGMVLQALSGYQAQPAVSRATEEALACLSAMQNADGSFSSGGVSSAESCAQVITALGELGISLNDSRFVKNGCSVLDALMSFSLPGGGFRHSRENAGPDLMATEQALYALASAVRSSRGLTSLYHMTDVVPSAVPSEGSGLPGKHEDVSTVPVTYPGTTFTDIAGHRDREAIEALAERGIINGRGSGLFAPDDRMTRAEFAAITVRSLGLAPLSGDSFTDVPAGRWFSPFVGTAARYGIVNGVGGGLFLPDGTITRQEAAVMVARAAKLCGMDPGLDDDRVRDTLAPFADYMKIPAWARQGLAFCFSSGILDGDALEIRGSEAVLRCEIARMLFRMLDRADLL